MIKKKKTRQVKLEVKGVVIYAYTNINFENGS